MLIQVQTDNHIKGGEELSEQVHSIVESALGHFAARISRVEVHLSDENGPRAGGDDIRCSIEARVDGMKPIGVTSNASDRDVAVTNAAEKLQRALEHALGRIEANSRNA